MANRRTTMRKVRDILRLRYDLEMTYREIAQSLGMGTSTVGDCLNRARAAGLEWPIPQDFDDNFIENLLYHSTEDPSRRTVGSIDYDYIHKELRRKHVTLQLLWQEYRTEYPNGYQYSQFCNNYRNWRRKVDVVMRQRHRPGERLFVDYAGRKIPIFDPHSGEKLFDAEIFIATLGASNYTYAEATRSQEKSHWIRAHINAFNFLGGVPQLIVPDNLKSGVSKVCRYEPNINPTYYEMARHYGSAIMPTRPRKPRDKSKVEAAVLLVERWIMAALRNYKFFSLSELNKKIHHLLERLNNKEFQKLNGSRKSLFLEVDKPSLLSLPANPYLMTEGKVARVHIDYHVEISKHYYSVPYTLVKKEVEVRFNDQVVEMYWNNRKVASHLRKHRIGGYSTIKEHMPRSHRSIAKWTPDRLKRWARESGPHTAEVSETIMKSKPHPEIGYKAVLGLISLGRKYGKDRLEAACERSLKFGDASYRNVKNILASGFDKIPLKKPPSYKSIDHENIRGPSYYNNILKEKK